MNLVFPRQIREKNLSRRPLFHIQMEFRSVIQVRWHE